ncbi:hypothetical protein A2272_00185 [Candidatus Peregrinibacteria bacterium RIFOXYA12_FULL_33_12]|nr:MAG: hypothetical protein A2263_03290 [Candidatus Peregrinibacteria bacterium RIFOXYA2_FULL_33_21]OGJ46535.1 MAG: hypothetical protein A2272_00185 [Candidatus Peregrinibacteria bacterium RIFOXYA12_FULL_33_12]
MSQINPHIFRAYDIRGIAIPTTEYPIADLTEDTMYLMGKGIGSYLIENEGKKIAIGRDVRLTGEILQKAFVKGLLEIGCHVIDFGVVSSPMIYYAVCKYKLDGGVVITASHNPKEYNGVKVIGKNAHSICGEQLQEIYKKIEGSQWSVVGDQLRQILKAQNLFESYLEDLKKKFTLKRKLKIAVDSGNGVTGPFIAKILKNLGAEVIELFTDPDGNFPNHEANPEYEENLQELMVTVKREKADFGFGFDGDGDRIGVIDEKGEFHASDKILILLVRDLLKRHPKSKIVFDVKCSTSLRNEINKLGGIPVVSKTGHSHIEEKMNKEGCMLGGEVSGHLFFGENYYGFDDAIFAATKIAYILSTQNQTLSQLLSDIPHTFTTPEIKVACSDEYKFQIVEKLKEYFLKNYKDCLTLDGIRVNFSDTAWGIVRCSNTSPNLTLRFEAETKEKLMEIQNIFAKAMEKFPEIAKGWIKE